MDDALIVFLSKFFLQLFADGHTNIEAAKACVSDIQSPYIQTQVFNVFETDLQVQPSKSLLCRIDPCFARAVPEAIFYSHPHLIKPATPDPASFDGCYQVLGGRLLFPQQDVVSLTISSRQLFIP